MANELELGAYFLLFISAFGAASVLPFSSEPLFIHLLWQNSYNPILLWTIASIANTLGALLNWYLAAYCLRWQSQAWFPINTAQLERASGWFKRYGVYSLLLSWAPLIGDALTFAAGLLRTRLDLFLLLVGLAKAGRYAFLWWLSGQAMAMI